ncbi:MAG: transglycosylase SLT domain-containing protein, partial [Pseudomonadales bacterium]
MVAETLWLSSSQAAEKHLPPGRYLSVWERIRNGYQLPVVDNKRVHTQRRWYAKHPEYMMRVSKRSTRYMHYVVEQLDQAGLPLELALLPIVESAFDPFAYSHGRASGMWQFISATGKRYGQQQNWWYDGRRDIAASTAGAIGYLTNLHRMFDGDWLLALAAYNTGEGNVRRAVRKNKRAG